MKTIFSLLGTALAGFSFCFAAFAPLDTSLDASISAIPVLQDDQSHLIQISYNLAADDTCKVIEFQVATEDTADWQPVPLRLLVENGYKTSGNNTFKWYYKYTVQHKDTVVMLLRFRVGNKNACEKGWRTCEPMPRSRWRMQAEVLDGNLYVVGGGTDPASHVDWVEMYDPVDDAWTARASLLTPRDAPGTAIINDTLYAVGGYNGGYDFQKTMEYYDPGLDAWTYGASMRYGRSNPCAEAVNGKLYVIGGTDQVHDTIIVRDAVEEYDPAMKTWQDKAPMPTKRTQMASAVYDGKIYTIGGLYYDVHPFAPAFFNTVEIYDPATDEWTTGSSMPSKRSGAVACVLDGKIYVMGGQCDTLWTYPSPTYSVRLNDVEIYDPDADEWTTGASLLTERTLPAAGVINGTIYVVGGQRAGQAYAESSYLAVNEAFKPHPEAKYSPFLTSAAITLDMTSGISEPVPVPVGAATGASGGRMFLFDLPGYGGGTVRGDFYDVLGVPVIGNVPVTVTDGKGCLRPGVTGKKGSSVYFCRVRYGGIELFKKLIDLR